MNGNNYWQERYLKDKARSINLSEKYIKGRLKKYYTEAGKEIETEIEGFYEKYAKEEKLTLADARKRISATEFNRSKFEKMAKETADLKRKYGKNIPEGIAKQIEEQERLLNTLSKKGAVTRMENLKAGIDNAILKFYDKQQITMFDLLKEGYEDGYYRGMFRIQHGLGVGTDFTRLNERAIRQAVLTDHGKGNFSKRLYQHSKTLSKDLQENITVGLIRGESVDKMAKRISRRLDVSMSNAKRLVRTETAYIHEKATLESYKEAGITTYRFVATLDMKTSEICQELDRKEFPVDKAMPGENFPPMHPNCRSTTEAVFDKEMESTRIARDADGSQYMVPRDMTYGQWREKYVAPKLENTESLEILGVIDIDNASVVESTLRNYEELIANDVIENAIIITATGKVIHCTGDLNGVNPEILKEELEGAIVTHNHPEGSNNEYSFSSLDLMLFNDYRIRTLRGVDERYIYEITRDYTEVDESIGLLDMNEDGSDYMHNKVIEEARRNGVGYKRRRKD